MGFQVLTAKPYSIPPQNWQYGSICVNGTTILSVGFRNQQDNAWGFLSQMFVADDMQSAYVEARSIADTVDFVVALVFVVSAPDGTTPTIDYSRSTFYQP